MVDIECDNTLSKVTSCSHNAVERISNEKNAFQLAILTYEVDGFNNALSFKEFQCVNNFKKIGDE